MGHDVLHILTTVKAIYHYNDINVGEVKYIIVGGICGVT